MSSPLHQPSWRSRVKLISALAIAALIAVPLPAAGAGDPLESAQDRAAELRARLDSLQRAAAAAVGEFEAVHSELEQAVGEFLTAESALNDARSRNENAQDHAGERVRAIYKSGGRTALYASVLRAGDPQDALSRVANISAIVSVDTASADRATASEAKAVVAAAKFERAIGVRQKLEVEAEKQTLETLADILIHRGRCP